MPHAVADARTHSTRDSSAHATANAITVARPNIVTNQGTNAIAIAYRGTDTCATIPVANAITDGVSNLGADDSTLPNPTAHDDGTRFSSMRGHMANVG